MVDNICLKYFNILKRSWLHRFFVLVGVYFLVTFGILSSINETELFDRSCSVLHFKKDNLLSILRMYRSLKKRKIPSNKTTRIKSSDDDILFNVTNYCEAKQTGLSFYGRFYEPKFLINNQDACKLKDPNAELFFVFVINSHRANFAQRQIMRQTWMSVKYIYLKDLLNSGFKRRYSSQVNTRLELVHLFIVGSAANESNDVIIEENKKYNDMLLIDTSDAYKNVVYKHLAVINWINEHCHNATFYAKMDDDVMVNLIPFVWNVYTNFVIKHRSDFKFIYCDITEFPNTRVFNKNKTIKWYTPPKVYPFDYFPNYCKGLFNSFSILI
jgi:hypothetical protein